MKFFGAQSFESIMQSYYKTMDALTQLINQRNAEIDDLNVTIVEKTGERNKASQVLEKMKNVYGC